MSDEPLDHPEGWEHVLAAADLLFKVADDIFRLPEVAEDRAKAAKDSLGDDHGDDLVCGCWGAALQASALLQLLGRQINAALILVRTHAMFAAPISTLARTVIEQGLRIAWLLGDPDVHNRERRFLELEREERRLYEAIGRTSREDRLQWEEGLAKFLADLPGKPQSGIPSTEDLAKEYGESGALYLAYRLFSQPVHGTAAGANSFHVETRKTLLDLGHGSTEWIDSEFVSFPLATMWESASIAMNAFRDLLAPAYECSSLALKDEFKAHLAKVPPNAGWTAEQDRKESHALLAQAKGPPPNRAQRRRTEKLRRQKK